MIVYGKNVFQELKGNQGKIRKVYFGKNFKDQEIIQFVKHEKIPYETVDSFRLDHLADGNHQGIVLDIFDYTYYTLNDAMSEETLVILDHLEDVHNFGAIIRTCEAAGIRSIIIPKDRSVVVNGTVMKTSSGALDHVKVIMVSNLVQTIEKLKTANYFVYAADMDGEDYRSVSYASKKVLVIGSEGNGVSRLVKESCDVIVRIPMDGQVNSLNASVAAGILIYGMKE